MRVDALRRVLCFHTAGTTGSIPVPPTKKNRALAPSFPTTSSSVWQLVWAAAMADGRRSAVDRAFGGRLKSGYVSRVRYDHYSTARTIEAALGLPGMTSNDEYARAFDDVVGGH